MCFVFISSLSLSLPLLFCVLLGRFSASRLPVSSSSSSPSSSLEKSRRQLSDQQLITFPLATRHLIRPYLSHRVPLYGCRVPPPPTHLPNCFFSYLYPISSSHFASEKTQREPKTSRSWRRSLLLTSRVGGDTDGTHKRKGIRRRGLGEKKDEKEVEGHTHTKKKRQQRGFTPFVF